MMMLLVCNPAWQCIVLPLWLQSTFVCQVLKFIEDFSNLKAMGFAPEVIAGAMIAFPDDMAEVMEACISCSS